MGAIFDSNDDITGYQCVECTSIIDPNTGVAWVSGSTIDCSITAIESEFCGTNMYPSKLIIRFDMRVVGKSRSWKVIIFIQLRSVLSNFNGNFQTANLPTENLQTPRFFLSNYMISFPKIFNNHLWSTFMVFFRTIWLWMDLYLYQRLSQKQCWCLCCM